jgi:aryl-phospho-beta-D-glucosidase BglC (GH1 family)
MEVTMRYLKISLLLSVLALTPPVQATFLHRQGNKLIDEEGKTVRLTGVNWFGFETSNMAPHGLWARDWLGMLIQVKEMGFNCVRLPFCDRMLDADAKVKSISTYGSDPYRGVTQGTINKELEGKSPLEVLDIIIGGCRQVGLKVILDNHSREPDGYMEEKVWTAAGVSEEKWIADWVMLAKRYKGNNAVVAFDLDNEPHGTTAEGGAQWGTAGKDWKVAAQKCGNAILAENPDVLIVVEGVQQVGSDGYWWGGNLIGAKTAPIVLSKPDKLVYSPHEYGPEVFAQTWFTAADFPKNMPGIWDKYFGYLNKGGQAHLLVGEFGILNPEAAGGKAGVWFDEFLKYMGTDYSWTFWCLNPNSGDTGGLLKYDWLTPEQWKLDKLRPYMDAPIGKAEGIAIRRPGLRPARSGTGPARTPVDAAGRRRQGPAAIPLFDRP